MVMSNLLRNKTRLSDFEKSGIIIRYNIYKYKEIYMVDKIGSGNKFDAAWKEAKAQLIKDGNSKPSTQDILHYLIDKWKPQNNDPNKIVVQGFHLEHDSTPQVNTKYGANIGCQQDVQEAVTKYGANIGCQQDVQEAVTKYGANIGCQQDVQEAVTKYGANIGCQQDVQEAVTKYGANIGCQQDVQEAVTKYGANIGCQQDVQEAVTKYGANIGCSQDTVIDQQFETPQIVTKYGANIGCGDHTFKVNNRELIDKIKISIDKNNIDSAVVYDRQTGTLHLRPRKSE